jgi:LPS export ABC transporter protein LptC
MFHMSKSKLTFMALLIGALVAAVSIYLNQSGAPIEREFKASLVKSKLNRFELYKYKNGHLVARATGNNATLFAQGRLICDGRMRMVRIDNGQRQEIESDQAEITFQNENFFGDSAGMVDTILFTGNVDYIRGATRFQSDWIKYSDKTGEAFTDKPVRIDSDSQFIAAEGGMIYNTKTEALRMRGGVFGSVRSDLMKSNAGGTTGK